MRLIHTTTFEIKDFIQREIPEYAILSHTWGEEECTLQDMQSGAASRMKGYSKIEGCCKKATEDGYDYCWVDTCCIDKTSSAELSEAINSMYKWYQDSAICYVYLQDMLEPSAEQFAASRWHTRGWTLQELIAPSIVEFYDANWNEYGTRLSLRRSIIAITGITSTVLSGGSPWLVNVATRMSWAAQRITTRVEDEAYCLMGLFQVNMPLLYGEGRKAFRRLQEEIIRTHEDYTIFVWPRNRDEVLSVGLLSNQSSDFDADWLIATNQMTESCAFDWNNLQRTPFSVLQSPTPTSVPFSVTSRGLHISMPVFSHRKTGLYGCLSVLTDLHRNSREICVCVELYEQSSGTGDCYQAVRKTLLLPREQCPPFHLRTFYVWQPSVAREHSYTMRSLSDRMFTVLGQLDEKDTRHVHLQIQDMIRAEEDLRKFTVAYESDALQQLSNFFNQVDLANMAANGPTTFFLHIPGASSSQDFTLTRDCFAEIAFPGPENPRGGAFRIVLRDPSSWTPCSQCSGGAATSDFIATRGLVTDRLTLHVYFCYGNGEADGHELSMKLRRICLPHRSALPTYIFSIAHRALRSDDTRNVTDVIQIQTLANKRPLRPQSRGITPPSSGF